MIIQLLAMVNRQRLDPDCHNQGENPNRKMQVLVPFGVARISIVFLKKVKSLDQKKMIGKASLVC